VGVNPSTPTDKSNTAAKRQTERQTDRQTDIHTDKRQALHNVLGEDTRTRWYKKAKPVHNFACIFYTPWPTVIIFGTAAVYVEYCGE